MKILSISDVVANSVYSTMARERFAGVNVVLACGDLPAYYLEFVVSMLDVPLYYVMGNHADEHHAQSHAPAPQPHHWANPSALTREAGFNTLDDQPSGPSGCTNIDGKIVNYKGVLIAGLQGSIWYNGGPYQYTEQEMARKILLLQPQMMLNRMRHGRAMDILITHSPPAGIHDDVDVAHHGFRCFLKLMDDAAPRYLIHGHKHVYVHGEPVVTQYQHTTVINTYGFRLLDLEEAGR